MSPSDVPKTIQIRDLDDDVYRGLARRAAEVGLSVPEFLRAEVTRLASRPRMTEWLDRTRSRASGRTVTETLEALDAVRGDRPDARR